MLELLESHARGTVLEVATQTQPPSPLPAHASLFDQVDKKRKRDKKGKEVAEEGKSIPSKELEPPKGAKIAKGAQRKPSSEGAITKRTIDCRPQVPIWNPTLELDGAHLPMDSSVRDFQKGKAGYVADALEHPLLLLQDMANLRSLKRHEVFLTLKRDLAMVSLQALNSIISMRCFPSLTYSVLFFLKYRRSNLHTWGNSGQRMPTSSGRMRRANG